MTGRCEKQGRRVQDFITFSRLWRLYVSFMFLVLLNGVLESQLKVLIVVSVILQTLITKSKESYTELTKTKILLFQNSSKVEVNFLCCKLCKAQQYMKSLVLTFLQRFGKCTFIKVFKILRKFNFSSKLVEILVLKA